MYNFDDDDDHDHDHEEEEEEGEEGEEEEEEGFGQNLIVVCQPLFFDYLYTRGVLNSLWGIFCLAINLVGLVMSLWMVFVTTMDKVLKNNATIFFFKNIAICQVIWLIFSPLITLYIFGDNSPVFFLETFSTLSVILWMCVLSFKYVQQKIYGGYTTLFHDKLKFMLIVYIIAGAAAFACTCILYKSSDLKEAHTDTEFMASLFVCFFAPALVSYILAYRNLIRGWGIKDEDASAGTYFKDDLPLKTNWHTVLFIITWFLPMINFILNFIFYIIGWDFSTLEDWIGGITVFGAFMIHLQIFLTPIIYFKIARDWKKEYDDSVNQSLLSKKNNLKISIQNMKQNINSSIISEGLTQIIHQDHQFR